MPVLGQIMIFTSQMDEMIAFYSQHFGYEVAETDRYGMVRLRPRDGGSVLLLHPASRRAGQGRSGLKLVFTVEDVEAFCDAAKARGLSFGKIFKGDGYHFADTKDPDGNAVQVSIRAAFG